MFQIFTELCEFDLEDAVWRERARWIKYEEDVQEEAGRWGSAHVSSLSFHSVLELRKCLEHGTLYASIYKRWQTDGAVHILEHYPLQNPRQSVLYRSVIFIREQTNGSLHLGSWEMSRFFMVYTID